MVKQGELTGEVLASVSREMVRLKAQHYGKGPTEAKTYVCDDFLFCVLKGGLTRVEETLISTGDADLVREVRLRFQAQMDNAFTGAVARLTGREVVGYQSQVVFDPDYIFEIFVLKPNEQAGSTSH